MLGLFFCKQRICKIWRDDSVVGGRQATPRPSAVDLKFLSVVRRARIGTSNPKPHQNHNVASVPLIPKFASGVPQVLANFGIGTLARRREAETASDAQQAFSE